MRRDADDDFARALPSGAEGHDRSPPRRWTGERIARLAFLAGQGQTAKRIGRDPLVNARESTVYAAAHRYGIWLSDAPRGALTLRLPADVLVTLERVARDAGLTPAALMRDFATLSARGPRPFEARA